MSTWQFTDPPNVATFTTLQVMKGNKPILFVTHDAEDGSWQFLTGELLDVADVMIVGLAQMVGHDATLIELANLPMGWRASRKYKGADWQRAASSSA